MGLCKSKSEKVDPSVMTKGFFDLEENCVDDIASPFSNLKNDKNKAFLIVNVATY